jgi:hypothetical protein
MNSVHEAPSGATGTGWCAAERWFSLNPALEGIWEHMRDLGLGALAHANRHAAYYAMENPSWADLAVVQAAHAAELLIKARIAQEHPLLIFEQLPRSTQVAGDALDVEDLFRQGRTIQWSDLPERLWAVTGERIPCVDRFNAFGKLRNGVQHFAPPSTVDIETETLQFVFEVIDPFIQKCWSLYAIDYDEDSAPYEYFTSTLISQEILFLVSPDAAEAFQYWDVDWSTVREDYKREMLGRVEVARAKMATVGSGPAMKIHS